MFFATLVHVTAARLDCAEVVRPARADAGFVGTPVVGRRRDGQRLGDIDDNDGACAVAQCSVAFEPVDKRKPPGEPRRFSRRSA